MSKSMMEEFLVNNPGKHLNAFQKGQLVVAHLYYCVKCRKVLPLDQFDDDPDRTTGISSTCKNCACGSVDRSEWTPPETTVSARDLAAHFDGVVEGLRSDGAKRLPKTLTEFVREHYGDKVEYCASCKHFHVAEAGSAALDEVRDEPVTLEAVAASGD